MRGSTRCPACGDPVDYCSGHGKIGDRRMWDALLQHDEGDHTECHPVGCQEKAEILRMQRG